MPPILPRCHKCNEQLAPSNQLENDLYVCKKHKKVYIHRDVLNSLIDGVIVDVIRGTNLNLIEEQTLATLLKLQSTIKEKKRGIEKRFELEQWKLFTELNFAKQKSLVYEMEQTLNTLIDDYRDLIENEVKIKKKISEVKQLVNVVVRKLEELPFNEYREILVKSFIKDATVNNGYVNFELYYADFYSSSAG